MRPLWQESCLTGPNYLLAGDEEGNVRKVLAVIALSTVCAPLGVFGLRADTLPEGTDGCAAFAPFVAQVPPGTYAYQRGCKFVATRPGGYYAAAASSSPTVAANYSACGPYFCNWSISVWNSQADHDALRPPRLELGSLKHSDPCGPVGVIQPGNYVDVYVTQGFVVAGNPSPTGAPDPGLAGSCAGLGPAVP